MDTQRVLKVSRERHEGTRVHMVNEELGRHKGREGKTECSLCGDE